MSDNIKELKRETARVEQGRGWRERREGNKGRERRKERGSRKREDRERTGKREKQERQAGLVRAARATLK